MSINSKNNNSFYKKSENFKKNIDKKYDCWYNLFTEIYFKIKRKGVIVMNAIFDLQELELDSEAYSHTINISTTNCTVTVDN